MTTTFLERNRFDLATAAVVAPLASYGLSRMFPAPNVGFLAVASLMNLCATIVIRDLPKMHAREDSANERSRKSTQPSEFISPILLHRLYAILNSGSNVLLPVFARYVGQRMGIQVPDYLPTIGYINLAGNAFWAAKHAIDILY